jgi:hypothetical protein
MEGDGPRRTVRTAQRSRDRDAPAANGISIRLQLYIGKRPMATPVVSLLVGGALLLLGRRLYWLFVAGVGFAVALNLVPRVVQTESVVPVLAIALAAGLVGAALAVLLQRAAIGMAGFLAGGYVVLALLEVLGAQASFVSWVLAFAGGAAGVFLTQMLFGWALILLSSLAGPAMIAQTLNVGRPVAVVVFLILLVAGAAVQGSAMLRREGTAR